MFGWFKAKTPLFDDQRAWIQSKFLWLHREFGDEILELPIVTPTQEFFPDAYSGSPDDAYLLLERLSERMRVDPSRLELKLYSSASADDMAVSMNSALQFGYALGAYDAGDQRTLIWLEKSRLTEPTAVVATLAHELGHVHLLGGGRCQPDDAEHEPLTDLLTVFFGLGIFSANSTIREGRWQAGNLAGWNISKQGYLTLAHYAHALAVYACARREIKPAWARYLRPDVQAWLKNEIRDIESGRRLSGVAESVEFSLRGWADETVMHREQQESARQEQDRTELRDREREFDEEQDEDDRDVDDQDHSDLEEDADSLPPRISADDWFSQGVMHTNARQYDEAIAAYTEALKIKPRDTEVRVHRANTYLALNRFHDAVQDCDLVIKQDAGDDDAHYSRAVARLKLGQFSAAIADYSQALRTFPQAPEVYLQRGLAQLEMKNYKSALADFDKAIRFGPMSCDGYLARSRAFEAIGNAKSAQADLLKAISLEPSLADESVRALRATFHLRTSLSEDC